MQITKEFSGITVAFTFTVMKNFEEGLSLKIGMVRQCHSDCDIENGSKVSKGGWMQGKIRKNELESSS